MVDAVLASYVAYGEGFARQLELLHAASVRAAPPPVQLADARKSLELITAIDQSDRTAMSVDPLLDRDAPGCRGWRPDGDRGAG